MARIVTEGFESGGIGDFVGSGLSASNSWPRSGGFSGKLYPSNAAVYMPVPEQDEYYIRFAFRGDRGYIEPQILFHHDGTELIELLSYGDSGPMRLYIGGVYVAQGSIIGYGEDTWYLLEAHVKIADVGGIVQFKYNGVLDIDYEGDTKPGSDTTINRIYMRGDTGSSNRADIDDIAINDVTGVVDNSWCGDGHIIGILPNGDGDNIDFTGSDADQVDNYAHVDERPNDGDTSYVESDTVGDYDLYELSTFTIPDHNIVTRLWVEISGMDPGAGNIAPMIKAGTTEDVDSGQALPEAVYGIVRGKDYTENPDDSQPWEQADIDSLQAGFKVVT